MKRRRSTARGGRKRAFRSDAAYRLHLRDVAEAGGEGTTARRALWYGSKLYKTAAERRPKKGGKVHS